MIAKIHVEKIVSIEKFLLYLKLSIMLFGMRFRLNHSIKASNFFFVINLQHFGNMVLSLNFAASPSMGLLK